MKLPSLNFWLYILAIGLLGCSLPVSRAGGFLPLPAQGALLYGPWTQIGGPAVEGAILRNQLQLVANKIAATQKITVESGSVAAATQRFAQGSYDCWLYGQFYIHSAETGSGFGGKPLATATLWYNQICGSIHDRKLQDGRISVYSQMWLGNRQADSQDLAQALTKHWLKLIEHSYVAYP